MDKTYLEIKVRTALVTKIVHIPPSMLVKDFIRTFVRKAGLPARDIQGRELCYQLHCATHKRPLKLDKSFALQKISSGMTLLLDTEALHTKTLPFLSPYDARTDEIELAPPAAKRWNRRAILLMGMGTLFCSGGLALGASAILISHAAKRPSQPAALFSPHTQVVSEPQMQVSFSQHQQPIAALAWAPNGLFLASGSEDGIVFIWDTQGNVKAQLTHPAAIRSLAWCPDSQHLVTGSANEVFFWQAFTNEPLARSSAHTDLVTSISCSNNDPCMVLSTALDKRAIVWKTDLTGLSEQSMFTHHGSQVEAGGWAADNITVATASQSGFIRVWETIGDQEIHGYYHPTSLAIYALSFSPIEQELAVAGEDGSVYLWNEGLSCTQQMQGDNQQCMTPPIQLHAHTKAVRALAWSPSGKFLASAGEDGKVIIWSPEKSAVPQQTLEIGTPIAALSWSIADAQLAVATQKSVHLWDLS